MEVLYPRCAGLDVHKDSVVACIASGSEVVTEVKTFSDTTTADFVELVGVARRTVRPSQSRRRECTWKPVSTVLCDSAFTLVLANAAHVKNVPGRKTNINDATGWPICWLMV